jgi:G2/mitotic-specific cyclin 2
MKSAKPAGIQKQTAPARTNSTRTVLGSKTANTASSELKRPASGSGVGGHVTKKRHTASSKTDLVEDSEASENVPPPKNGSNASFKVDQKSKTKIKPEPSEAFDDDDELSLEEFTKNAKDLDEEDMDDPLMVAEYVTEIFEYMKELEINTMPNPKYMDDQGELEWKMRGILVDWLLEVHTRFRLLPETLFLAVNIIDRFLSTKVVQLDRLQLVGVTAMFIASKYEEVLSPHVQNFVHVADDGFTEAEILSAERFVLAALDYDLSYPNPMNFLRRISKADSYDIQTRTLGKYLLEIGCLDHRFLPHPPSLVAAAAMYLARLAMDRGEWDPTLAKYAGYTEQQLMPVFKLMLEYLAGPVQHEAFFKKYASKKFLKGKLNISPRLHTTLLTHPSFHRPPEVGQGVRGDLPRQPTHEPEQQWQGDACLVDGNLPMPRCDAMGRCHAVNVLAALQLIAYLRSSLARQSRTRCFFRRCDG